MLNFSNNCTKIHGVLKSLTTGKKSFVEKQNETKNMEKAQFLSNYLLRDKLVA